MINPRQIQTIQVAARKTGAIKGKDDGAYRLILRNAAHVSSCKDLDNAGFEDVMAHFEELGFRMNGRPSDHFRNKVKLRGTFAGERLVFKIRELAAGTKYAGGLPGLCRRFSHDRTDQASKLTPAEAHALVEMLKSAGARDRAGQPQPPTPADAHGGARYFDDEPF